ncbi:MAG: S8 family peptidase [Sinomonas sp.]|nr:S8 family peptidase [Sinomonas sp.]
MSGEGRPLLALGAPEVGDRLRQPPAVPPKVQGPGAGRQGERLTPGFRDLIEAFDGRHAQLSEDTADEVDPELVLVFDLAGSVKDFRNAINNVDGLEFLTELLDEETEPDDDFHMVSRTEGRTEDKVEHSLYLVMSNAAAAGQLVRLFEEWLRNPRMSFRRGLTKFRSAFEQLRAIRRWGPADRVRETGLIENWRERIDVAGQYVSPVRVELELWYRRDAEDRRSAEAHLTGVIVASGGTVMNRAEIAGISYHALLVELPVQQVAAVLERGADAIELLAADEIMFVSPSTPMSVASPTLDPPMAQGLPATEEVGGLPRIALLDGLPFVNHDTLVGRLIVDDPDGLAENYAVSARHHGTAMASLIVHGDLSAPSAPLDRRLYVRPIMRPHEFIPGCEHVLDNELFPDLLHRAIRRIVDSDTGRQPAAPSVRVVNLSIGAESRALVRKMSPLGRLLDWLAVDLNLLFLVSAGNHSLPLTIPASAARTVESARAEAIRAARMNSRQRGILPPGDSLNALTIGAVHADASGEVELPDGVWDLTGERMPAHYGAVGPGVGRSIKPDLYHVGGRALYAQPVVEPGADTAELRLLETPATAPGTKVAAPGRGGATNTAVFTYGTSNATALVTREASRLFDVLEAGPDLGDPRFPDPRYHPVLAKALLVHASSWGDRSAELRRVLEMGPQRARRELTALLGYGALDLTRLGNAATNRAVLIAGGSIEREQRHTYQVPLPSSLRARRDWHRVTVTLAYMAPTAGQLTKYRGTKVFFETPDRRITAGSRSEAEHFAVRRGSCQHEIIEGDGAMVFGEGSTLPIEIECMKDAQTLRKGNAVRYGLVVSVETKVETSTTVHNEVRALLRTLVRAQTRQRI